MCSDQGVIVDLEAEIDTLRLEIEELEEQVKVLKQENVTLQKRINWTEFKNGR